MTVSPIDTLRMTRRLVDAGLSKAQSEEIAIYIRDTTALTQADLARRGEVENLQLALGDGLETMRRDFDFVIGELAALVRILRSEVTAASEVAARQSARTTTLLILLTMGLLAMAGVAAAVAINGLTIPSVTEAVRAADQHGDGRIADQAAMA